MRILGEIVSEWLFSRTDNFFFFLPLVEIQASLFKNQYPKSGVQTHSLICKLSNKRASKELRQSEYHTFLTCIAMNSDIIAPTRPWWCNNPSISGFIYIAWIFFVTLTPVQREHIRLPLGDGAILLYLPYMGINGCSNNKALQELFAGQSFIYLLMSGQRTIIDSALVSFPHQSSIEFSESVF